MLLIEIPRGHQQISKWFVYSGFRRKGLTDSGFTLASLWGGVVRRAEMIEMECEQKGVGGSEPKFSAGVDSQRTSFYSVMRFKRRGGPRARGLCSGPVWLRVK